MPPKHKKGQPAKQPKAASFVEAQKVVDDAEKKDTATNVVNGKDDTKKEKDVGDTTSSSSSSSSSSSNSNNEEKKKVYEFEDVAAELREVAGSLAAGDMIYSSLFDLRDSM
jgi:hypothetical protein